jgi:hypothetical protein
MNSPNLLLGFAKAGVGREFSDETVASRGPRKGSAHLRRTCHRTAVGRSLGRPWLTPSGPAERRAIEHDINARTDSLCVGYESGADVILGAESVLDRLFEQS